MVARGSCPWSVGYVRGLWCNNRDSSYSLTSSLQAFRDSFDDTDVKKFFKVTSVDRESAVGDRQQPTVCTVAIT